MNNWMNGSNWGWMSYLTVWMVLIGFAIYVAIRLAQRPRIGKQ